MEVKQSKKKIMPFGKYKGSNLTDLPSKYVAWLLRDGNITDELRHNIEVTLLVKYKEEFIQYFIKENYKSRHYPSSYRTSTYGSVCPIPNPCDFADTMSYCLPNSY